jgi:pimeloyl-ACP methyl ester carboxylesterase
MPYIDVEGAALYYEEMGAGDPVVFVHGGWSNASTWALTMPELPASLRAIAYDRRGYSRSGPSTGITPRRLHEDDLAQLIEALDIGPAHVVGNSYGACTALGLAARRPELFQSVVAHEPPFMSVVGDDPWASAAIARADASLETVLRRVEAGDPAGAAEQFVEEVALGRGMWAVLPEPLKAIMIANAQAVVDDIRAPAWADIDLECLAGLDVPVLLTQGDRSPGWFLAIIARLHEAIPSAQVVTIPGASHNPHGTHPADFAAVVATHVDTQKEAVR